MKQTTCLIYMDLKKSAGCSHRHDKIRLLGVYALLFRVGTWHNVFKVPAALVDPSAVLSRHDFPSGA